MSVQQDIARYLRTNRPKPFCDDCVKNNLGLARRQQAQATTASLAQSNDFTRGSGICSDCGEEKLVANAR
jgi:hypothetical protein